MAKLSVFNLITLDGYFKGPNEDISWHNFGEDEQGLSDEKSNSGNTLVFGRKTYEMMQSYWTSKDAWKDDPLTTQGMNSSKKIVFSKTLREATWENTTLLNGDLLAEIKRLKAEDGPDMTILGSGQIVAQLAEANLIDDYSILINPLALGEGTTMFQRLTRPLRLKLVSAKTMRSGNVLLNYKKIEPL